MRCYLTYFCCTAGPNKLSFNLFYFDLNVITRHCVKKGERSRIGVREEKCVLAYGTVLKLLGNVESITKRLHESKVDGGTNRFEPLHRSFMFLDVLSPPCEESFRGIRVTKLHCSNKDQ